MIKSKVFLLVSIISFQVINTKAAHGEIKQIYNFGQQIQKELENNLAIEFKKSSDAIFANITVANIPDYIKRSQANCKVDLMKVLDASMSKIMVSKIEEFVKKAETEFNRLSRAVDPQKYQTSIRSQGGIPWPHTPHFRRVIESRFVLSPTIVKIDLIKCKYCGAEVFGLQDQAEKGGSSDLPQYYHKYNCKFHEEVMQINEVSDLKLSVQQRIKYAYENSKSAIDTKTLTDRQKWNIENYKIDIAANANGEIDPKISESLSVTIPVTDILRIITSYTEHIKLVNFINFYSKLGQIPGWVLLDKFLSSTDASSCGGTR